MAAMKTLVSVVLALVGVTACSVTVWAQPVGKPGALPVGQLPSNPVGGCTNCETSGSWVPKTQPDKGQGSPGAGAKQQAAASDGSGGSTSQLPDSVTQSKSRSSDRYKKDREETGGPGSGSAQSEQSKRHSETSKQHQQDTAKALRQSQQKQKETIGVLRP